MLKVVAMAAGIVVVLVAAFIVWAVAAGRRGMRKRDGKLLARLDPVVEKIRAGDAVSPQEVEVLAARPELRFMLFALLREAQRPAFVPSRYSSSAAQGESALAYWMMHPNELQDAPETIECVETIRRTVDGQEADFHVYRYRMPAGHWAAEEGWILGVAGPMKPDAEPYADMPGAFSRARDVEGKVTPSELVDWYVGTLGRKGPIRTEG
jgi:hypothetical protein